MRALGALLVAVPLAALTIAACGHAPIAPTVSLRMRGGPPNASVTVDDQFVGPLDVVQAKGVALPPGKHRISVEAAGYLPWDEIVEAADPNRPVFLDVSLRPIPD